jgi:hypothetical protein
LAKNWLTVRSTNFCFATPQQLSAGRYKFGDINNNELLIINLAAVRADGNTNISSSPSPNVGCNMFMTHLNLFVPFLLATLLSCSLNDDNKAVSADSSTTLHDTTNIDSIKFSQTWNSFADAVIHNDIKHLKELSTNCIYCTYCVTDTKDKDSLFTDFQNKNKSIWYDKLYNELSYIQADQFFKEDYQLIFDSNIVSRIADKSKVNFLNRGNDTMTNVHTCYKNIFKDKFPNVQEVLVTRIDPSPKYEGAQVALDFIMTKSGYKFFSFYTIP